MKDRFRAVRHLFIFFVIFSSLSACDFKTPQDYLQEAEKLSGQEKYQEAIQLLDLAIEKDSSYLGAYINRGADKSALGDFKGAILDYKKVLKIDPENTLALFNIGNNFKRLENYKEAIGYYNRAFDSKGGQGVYIDYGPNDLVPGSEFDVEGHEIHFERGVAYYYVDSLEKATIDFRASINKNFMTAQSYYWVGYIYLASGQNDQACEFFEKARQLGDQDAERELAKYCGNDLN